MELEEYFPVWKELTERERALLAGAAVRRSAPKGTLLHAGVADCVGLMIVRSGQLRAFILSDEGKEITIYRLFERDMCLFSASCIMKNIQFDIAVEAEKDAELWVIPSDVYKRLSDSSLAVANYTNQLMAARFSEVMWLVEQIMWKSFDKRLAEFLLAESTLDGGDVLRITHDKIAAHLGTAREVVTRMLRYFQSEGMVSLSRGAVELTDRERLQALAD
ncbi:Crp/Fnr family transcriptional regulator [Oscillibacter sp.]|uniref:Crp/Fnr family transcriptional regulator n=1 Tax=Oscillibacter sp. TaxID=1945593 RepID=UPI00289AB492|nr:Crp/Fnr family transcriptional regulator [Oscillibacter sp.]